MRTINIHAAKAHLFKLLERVASGEEIIIAKAGTPIAKLGPLAPAGRKKRRRLGILARRAKVPAGFHTPLPSEVLDSFEGR